MEPGSTIIVASGLPHSHKSKVPSMPRGCLVMNTINVSSLSSNMFHSVIVVLVAVSIAGIPTLK